MQNNPLKPSVRSNLQCENVYLFIWGNEVKDSKLRVSHLNYASPPKPNHMFKPNQIKNEITTIGHLQKSQ